jgi:GWxTD domain-containing protein
VGWRNAPRNEDDLETAIAQLRYIAARKELKVLQGARPPHNQTLFDRFWERYDPDPASEGNELKSEYYERVAISNSSFSWARFPGWKSDRGRMYILYGEPSVRERFESTFDQPAMERWQYDEADRTFVFVDEFGFGEYRLVPDLQAWATDRDFAVIRRPQRCQPLRIGIVAPGRARGSGAPGNQACDWLRDRGHVPCGSIPPCWRVHGHLAGTDGCGRMLAAGRAV